MAAFAAEVSALLWSAQLIATAVPRKYESEADLERFRTWMAKITARDYLVAFEEACGCRELRHAP